jgi:hypothetical protein
MRNVKMGMHTRKTCEILELSKNWRSLPGKNAYIVEIRFSASLR